MPVTRRDFLKLSGFTTAGAFLGGSAFLTGCKARPDKLRGTRESTTICPYCGVGCGLIVSTRNGRVVNIEGDPDHPINKGSLCSKGSALHQVAVNPINRRLTKVQYRRPGGTEWEEITWDRAITMIAERVKRVRDQSFVTRANDVTVNRTPAIAGLGGAALDNEECYLWSKCARLLGITYLEHQARLCHSPSVASLAASFGRGAMTNAWGDIAHADVILLMGSNAAETHPISFKYVTKAREKGAKLIVVDPRVNRSASIADLYAPLRPGTDIALLNGIINYLLQNDKIQREYVVEYTNASYLIDPRYSFNDGIFSGYDAAKRQYNKDTWKYQLDSKGIPKQDSTLQDPQCVYQLMKRHFARYTPEKVSAMTGCPVSTFNKIAELIASTSAPDKVMTIMYAMGTTQHTVGTQNIRSYAIIQLLLGNIGLAGGGIQATVRATRTAEAEALTALLDRLAVPSSAEAADRARLSEVRQARQSALDQWFAEHAPAWDSLRATEAPVAAVEAAVQSLLERPLGRLLDAGTGTGRMLELLAAKATVAVGLDRSAEMLRLARIKLDAANLPRVELRLGDILAAPFADGAFDTLLLHQVLHFLDQPQAALAEAARLLAPGGQLLLVDYGPHDPEALSDRVPHRHPGFAREEMETMLAGAGLRADGFKALEGEKLAVLLWRGVRP